MGLMCSLRGHDWSERELEDERDERGNEVVLTVREYEVCSRCDARNLVSENTEVTTVADTGDGTSDDAESEETGNDEPHETEREPAAPPAEPDDDPVDDAVAAAEDEDAAVEGDDAAIIVDAEDDAADGATDIADGEPESPTEPAAAESGAVDPADEDAVVMTDDDDEPAVDVESGDTGAPEGAADAGETTADAAAEPADPHGDAATDDGVILPGEAEPSSEADERGHGEWPEHEQADAPAADETTAWPEHEGDDGGYDAQVPDDETADVEFGGGLAPEAGEDADAEGETVEAEEGHDAEFVDNAVGRAPEHERTEQGSNRPTDGESVTGITSASEATAPSEGTSTSPDAQLACPACGNAESRSRTSLRAGDICPECKRGYLAEANE
ncbi:hypothetical protein [Haloarchaeobius sp. FL176]|uniref:DUF7093 family protein n=1 Tax=Haloarchaeobius sp. FL176 TaxID=2967129 RepID=UPI002147860C|nr:hypothetical protein [Haloarchaeobius sp. FL176]